MGHCVATKRASHDTGGDRRRQALRHRMGKARRVIPSVKTHPLRYGAKALRNGANRVKVAAMLLPLDTAALMSANLVPIIWFKGWGVSG